MNYHIIPTVLFTTALFCAIPFSANAGPLKHLDQQLADPAITTLVKAKYAVDELVNPFHISVTTNNGIVVLAGRVNSNTEYEQAVSLAEATKGVKDVITAALKINNSHTPLEDLAITAKVKGLILREQLVSNKPMVYSGLKIETHDRIVYFSGTVPSAAIKSTLGEIADTIKGVKSVENTLHVVG